MRGLEEWDVKCCGLVNRGDCFRERKSVCNIGLAGLVFYDLQRGTRDGRGGYGGRFDAPCPEGGFGIFGSYQLDIVGGKATPCGISFCDYLESL